MPGTRKLIRDRSLLPPQVKGRFRQCKCLELSPRSKRSGSATGLFHGGKAHGLSTPKIMRCHLYGQQNFAITLFWAKTASGGTCITAVHMHQAQVPRRQPARRDRMPNSVTASENLLIYDRFIKTASARAKLLPVLITTLGDCSPCP